MTKFDDYSLSSLSVERKIENYSKDWYRAWDQSMETYPKGEIYFLQEDYIEKANEILMINRGAQEILLDAISFVRTNPFLSRLVWYFYNRIYNNLGEISPWTIKFPVLVHNENNINDFLGLIILMSGFDIIMEYHKSKGIPRSTIIDTFKDVRLWIDDFYEKQGRWGLRENQWLANYFTGKLFGLGRLQFEMTKFSGDVLVFKNRKDSRVIALSQGDIEFREDGLVNGTNDIYTSLGAWKSSFGEDSECYYGNPISPYGRAMEGIKNLPKDEWRLILHGGQPVLNIHIPADGRMDHGLCGESIEMAQEFFPKYFPDKKFHAFNCTTWLFEPQFQELLSQNSNIVKFQREFYLYPVLGDDSQAFERVFGEKPKDFAKAPRDTSIRRAMLDHYLAGGHLSSAGGFILMDDVDWGKELYQKGEMV